MAARRCPALARASKTSVRRRSSSVTARAARATTSPTSSASGCRRSTRSSSSSRRARRHSRPATCARGSAAARSASRRFGRRRPTATTADGSRPASSYNRRTRLWSCVTFPSSRRFATRCVRSLSLLCLFRKYCTRLLVKAPEGACLSRSLITNNSLLLLLSLVAVCMYVIC